MAPRKYELGKRTEAIEETRRRIIDATFDLHREKGVVATSMQDVAERADVALRTVYNHYPTIDDLVAGCTNRVISLLSPPTPEIFGGLDTFEERMRRLVEELFAMYERGSAMIEVARCEQSEVAGLADYVASEAAMREELVREALRPFKPHGRTVREATALADFYVWKAFTQQNLTTRQAVDVIHRSLVALANPDTIGKKGQER
jgi:AcrR family transcriptional regulator